MSAPVCFGPKVQRQTPALNHFARISQQNRKPLQSRPAATTYGRRCNQAVGHHVRTRTDERRRAGGAAQRRYRGLAECSSSERSQGVRSSHPLRPCIDRARSRDPATPARCGIGRRQAGFSRRAGRTTRKRGPRPLTELDGRIHQQALAGLLAAEDRALSHPRFLQSAPISGAASDGFPGVALPASGTPTHRNGTG